MFMEFETNINIIRNKNIVMFFLFVYRSKI